MGISEREGVERLREFVLERRKHMGGGEGISQQKLAERSGLSVGWVGMLESKRLKTGPLKDTLMKLVKGVLLPREQPGSLYNFLELVIAGSLDSVDIAEVARGELDPGVAMSKASHEDASWQPSRPSDPNLDGSLFYNRQERSGDLELVLSRIKKHLRANDYDVARRMLEFMFEQGAEEEIPPPVRAQRERKERGELAIDLQAE